MNGSKNDTIHIFKRDDKALLVEAESGYWQVFSGDSSSDIKRIFKYELLNSSCRGPNVSDYDTDKYPLECVFYLTNKCNFSCTYCYSKNNRQAHWASMDLNLFKKAVRLLFGEKRRNALNFLFFGGECLLEFDLLKKCVSYIEQQMEKHNKRVTMNVTSNGSLLNSEMIEFLKAHRISICISMDGPKDVHDSQRQNRQGHGTYQHVMNGIELLHRYKVPFSVNCSLSDPTQLEEVFSFFLRHQLSREIKISPVLPEGSAIQFDVGDMEQYNNAWAAETLKCARKLIDHNRASDFRVRELSLFSMIYHLVYESRPEICLRTPCAAAYGMIEFHPDGSIVTCDKTFYSPELGTVSNLKSISEPVSLLDILDDSPLIRKIRSRRADTIPKCSACCFKSFCGGVCTLGSYNVFKSFSREDIMCSYRYKVFEELLWLLAEDPQHAILLTYPDKYAS